MESKLPVVVQHRIDLEAKQYAFYNYVTAATLANFDDVSTWPQYAQVAYYSIKHYMLGDLTCWPYKEPTLAVEYATLKERCEKMEGRTRGLIEALEQIVKSAVPLEGMKMLKWTDEVKNISQTSLQQWKEGESNTPDRGEGKEVLYICPCCNGDGKETCTNPDHGFIDAIGGEIHRLGCPVCGHDPNHKVKNGGACNTCNGAGKVNMALFKEFCEETGYDDEPNQITQ